MCLFQFRVRSAYESNFCDAKFQFKFAHHTRIWVIQFCEKSWNFIRQVASAQNNTRHG